MAIIEIQGLSKPVAVALDWHSLPGATSERKEIDALTKREGIKFGCVVSDEDAGATVVGLTADSKEGTACGAAWLAAASNREALILLEPFEEDRFWLCAVRAGLPVPGRDIVISSAEIAHKLHEFIAAYPDSRVCSVVGNVDQLYPNVHPQAFAEIVVSTNAKRVRRISGINPATVGLIGVVVLAFAAWYGADSYLGRLRQLEAQAKLLEMTEVQKRTEAQKAEMLRKQHREAGEALIRQVVLEKPSVDQLIGTIMGELESKPMVLAGWQLVGFDCTQMSCELRWHRDGLGTVLGFIQAAERYGWATTEVTGSDAKTIHAINAAPRTATLESLDPDAAFRAALETKLQEASVSGMRYDLSKSELLEKQLPQPAQDPKQPAPPMEPLPWKVGTVTVKGSQLFELRELPDYVTHPGIALKNVRADLKLKEWTMELNYATR